MHNDQLAPGCSYSTLVFEGAERYWYKHRYIYTTDSLEALNKLFCLIFYTNLILSVI